MSFHRNAKLGLAGRYALALLAGGPRTAVTAAVVLSAVVAVPGVVDQGDLDARWVNAVPAAGVALALAFAVRRAAAGGVRWTASARGDGGRIALAAALLVLALPWVSAERGFHVPGDVFSSEKIVAEPGGERLAAVHLGEHHGFAGVLLAWSALLLSRVPAGAAVRAYLSLMFAYGLVNAVQDGWDEQLWKRGWVDAKIPSALNPAPTPIWLVVVATEVAVYVLWLRPHGRERRDG